MKKSFTILSIFSFVATLSFAQLDSLKIIPKNPTSIDSVRVIAYTTFTSGGCDQLNFSITTATNWVYVDACHESGIMAVMCGSVDTINLGVFTAGSYNLNYEVRRVNPVTDPTDCSGQPLLDSMKTTFSVTASSSIGKIDAPKNMVTLFPNPANGAIAIRYELDKAENDVYLVIYNIVGQEVKKIPLENKKGAVIENISNLSKGSYFYRIETPTVTGTVDRLNIIE